MNSKVLDIYKLLNKKNYIGALELARKLYELQNNEKDFYVIKSLAICYMLNSYFRQSYKYFHEANILKKDDFETVTNLALVAYEIQKYQQALDFAYKSIQLNEKQYSAYFTLARTFFDLKELSLAKENILKTLSSIGADIDEIFVNHEDIFAMYIQILFALKEQDKIDHIFIKLKDSPKVTTSFLNYLNRYSPKIITDTDINIVIQEIQKYELLQNNSYNSIKIAKLNFALGDYFLKKNINTSDEYFIKANSILSSIQRYKPLDHQRQCIQNIKNFYAIRNLKVNNAEKSNGLIFIVGLPRSGTTLVESILSSNEDTAAGGELDLLRFTEFKNFSQNELEKISDNYFKDINLIRKNKKYFIDKLPQNFELAGLISIIFPRAKIISIKRNYWDIAVSQFQQFYVKNVPFSSTFFSIAITAANHEFLMDLYLKSIDSDQILSVSYEELVLNQHENIKKLYDFCNINAEYKEDRRVGHISNTASASQVKSEIHKNSLKKESFKGFKDDFWKAFEMQKAFWKEKNV